MCSSVLASHSKYAIKDIYRWCLLMLCGRHTLESIACSICNVTIFDNFDPIMIYMQAVHSGADLESAIQNCMGYESQVLSVTGWLSNVVSFS